MQRLAHVITAIAVLTVGCKDQRILQPPASQGPAYMISDGAHSGNHFFFFLPPLEPDPSALFHPGRSMPDSRPSWKSAHSRVTRAAEPPSTA